MLIRIFNSKNFFLFPMQTKLSFIALLLCVVFLNSCNSRAKEEKNADEKLKNIEQLIVGNQFDAALLQIDTVNILYPRLVAKRKIAAALKDTILRRQSAKVLEYANSVLPQKLAELDTLQKAFKFEKDETYQEFGNFVYKSQITEQNTTRNYLKCYVDENADLYFISNVVGTKLNHKSLKVSIGTLSAQTDTLNVNDDNFHSFNNDGTYWETLTFKNEADSGITAFIASHKAERIKVDLIGTKKLSYYLADQDKKAIAATYDFWILKKDVKKLQNDVEKATIRIGRIQLRYKN